MQIYGLLGVFEPLLKERHDGIPPEDVRYLADSVIGNDKVLDMIEQYSTYNSRPVIYQASLVLAQTLLLIFNSSSEKGTIYPVVQPKILNYTALILWNIQLLLSSSFVRQKKVSSGVATLAVFGNLDCCALLARIFPRAMLKKVDADKRYIEWEPAHWKEFFSLVQNNFNTTTEQWNEECREELIAKLRSATIAYLREKYERATGPGQMRTKWNHEEFDVVYSCLESKCLVGHYYLSELIVCDDPDLPYLKEPVTDSLIFWNVSSSRI